MSTSPPSDPLDAPDPRELVSQLADPARSHDAWPRLVALGPVAATAVREGLGDGRWTVRRWCASWIAARGDRDAVLALLPLLHDSHAKVRAAAAWGIGRRRADPVPDAVPLLVERIREDESLRVRRHCVMLLAYEHAHPDLEAFFQELLDTESDPGLHRMAGIGLFLSRAADRAVGCSGERPGDAGDAPC